MNNFSNIKYLRIKQCFQKLQQKSYFEINKIIPLTNFFFFFFFNQCLEETFMNNCALCAKYQQNNIKTKFYKTFLQNQFKSILNYKNCPVHKFF